MANEKLRIATSHYHVGHAIAPMVALEKGFFKEEGFENFDLLIEGLIPAFVEKEALSVAMKERGVQVVLGAKINSALTLNSQGADLVIVSGWRYLPRADWYARAGIRSFADLKGKKIAVRDTGGISQGIIRNKLQEAGLDPENDVTWVRDRMFAYHNTRDHVDAVMNHKVDCVSSSPPYSDELEKMGCSLILSTKTLYPKGRPERVIVARRAVAEERRKELQAFLTGILRAFWLMRGGQPDNFPYLTDLESRLRAASPNEDERILQMFTVPQRLETMPLPVDGRVPIESLKKIGEEMERSHELPAGFPVEKALMDAAVKEAFRDLRSRKELASQWEGVSRVVEKWGY